MRSALEWQAEQAYICSCGGFVDETMAIGRDDDYDAVVEVCHRCAVRERTVRSYRNAAGDMAGIKVRTWENDGNDVTS